MKDLSKHFKYWKAFWRCLKELKYVVPPISCPWRWSADLENSWEHAPRAGVRKGRGAAPRSCPAVLSTPYLLPPGRFHPSGCGTAAGTQPGCGHPAGERHQGQGAAARAAHRRQEGWHQVGGAAAAERPQRRRAVQGNGAGSGPGDSTSNPCILTGKQNCSGGEVQLAPPVSPVTYKFAVLSCLVITKCSFFHILVMSPISLVTRFFSLFANQKPLERKQNHCFPIK